MLHSAESFKNEMMITALNELTGFLKEHPVETIQEHILLPHNASQDVGIYQHRR